MNTTLTVSEHYDSISAYMYRSNSIRRLGRFDPTFHRILKVPDAWKKEHPLAMPSNYLHDLILARVGLPDHPRVLDAGCGFGGTCFWLHDKIGGSYDGITASKVQVDIATSLALELGNSQNCRFHLASYDDPIGEEYDAIIAIESLLHSEDLGVSIANLSRSLTNNGYLVLVEDMLISNAVVQPLEEFSLLSSYWCISSFPAEKQYHELLIQNNLVVVDQQDLTSMVQLVTPTLANVLIACCRIAKILPVARVQMVARFHLAQLLLHRLYHKRQVMYNMIVAKKQAR